jgi:hypothetical protein
MIHARLAFSAINDPGARGFSIAVSRDRDSVSVRLRESRLGHKSTRFETEGGRTLLICVGHVYARSARTFSVGESLRILAAEYDRDGIEALRASIGGGMYALILIDAERGRLYALADFLSCMPLFYRAGPEGTAIGASQVDLARDSLPSTSACAEYLAFGYLPFHESLFPEVRRLGPRQLLSLDLGVPESPVLSEARLPAYPEPEHRISDEGEAIDAMDSLLTEYFSRLGDEPISSGLSGGYDSRLIAAYCSRKRLRLVTYDSPGTDEARFARKVAERLGLETRVFQIPSDAPSRYAEDFIYGMGTADSLESSHVFGNLGTLCESGPSYIIDGHVGDVILGGGYFFKLGGQCEPLWKILAGRDRYLSRPLSDDGYLERFMSGYGRRIGGLPAELEKEVIAVSRKGFLDLFAMARRGCQTDADMMELVLHRFRGALLISSGPISFMRRVPTLCPFYDERIFAACMSISKALRAGDRLYNAFYRRRFPELADIPKENTGGRALQGVIPYRIAHFRKATRRRLAKAMPGFLGLKGNAGGSISSFMERYFADEANVKFFTGIAERTDSLMRKLGLEGIGATHGGAEAGGETFSIRYLSLSLLLDESGRFPG